MSRYTCEYTNIEQQLLEGSLDLGFTCIDAIQRVQYQELYYDEMFGLAINHEGKVNHKYIYGTYLVALPCWALGTALGIVAGNSLPTKIVASLSVALYGMFLAIIIPQAKKDRIVGVLVVVSFLLSYICKDIPISSGTRTILLTIIISMVAAIIKPRKKEENV